MFDFDDYIKTTKKSKGVNTCEYIIIHHTWGGTYKSNCWYLSGAKAQVSTHFVVGAKGEAAKIGDPRDILWHAWTSQRGKKVGMNRYSMGIEVVWPWKEQAFTDLQYEKVVALVKHLQKAFWIPKEKILKHADITREGGKKEKVWDGKTKSRKVDIDRRLRADRGFPNFEIWRNALFS